MSLESSVLELGSACFSYNDKPFIEDIKLELGQGEFVGLLGANGSGKSTLLKLMGGMLRPASGTVSLWSKPLAAYRNRDRAKLISYLPQTLDKSVPFRVEDLAAMGLYPYQRVTGISLDDALAVVGLSQRRRALLTELSGGELRRAYIAMTLLQGAGLLLLDEPLANLDVRYQLEIMALLKDLNARKDISIFMALHDIQLALGFKRLVLIKEGAIIADGSPESVLTSDSLKEAFGIEIRIKKDGDAVYVAYEGGVSAPGTVGTAL